MPILETIEQNLKEALVKRDALTVSVLRLLKSALHNEAIARKKDLTEEEVMAVLKTQAKKRKESIEAYTQAGRTEQAEQEKAELAIIQEYLPGQMGEDAIKSIVQETIRDMGDSASNFGAVMGAVMKKTKGQADGSTVSRIVKESLQ